MPAVRGPMASPWHHAPLEGRAAAAVRESAHSLLHQRTETPLRVPLEVNVVLVGFGGDAGYRFLLDVEALREFMQRSFAAFRPTCLETGRMLEVEHELSYVVTTVGEYEVTEIERAVHGSMVDQGTINDAATNQTVNVYDVDAARLELSFDALYDYLFQEQQNAVGGASDGGKLPPAAVFILNLDKVRMDPRRGAYPEMPDTLHDLTKEQLRLQEAGYMYRYTYNGAGHSQTWIGANRYAVIDVSAGPCSCGMLGTEEGNMGPYTVPRVSHVILGSDGDPAKGQHREDYFRGRLSALIVSTVEHILAPNVRYETLDIEQRILVAVIALQNHHKYNPFEHYVDISAIEHEVKQMAHPGQSVLVIHGVHSLHDHERIAMALARAVRVREDFVEGVKGSTLGLLEHDANRTQRPTYLDGAFLVEEFRHSSDMLAAGLLDAAAPHVYDEFFHTPMEHVDGELSIDNSGGLVKKMPSHSAILPVKQGWEPRNRGKKKKRTMGTANHNLLQVATDGLQKSYGTRVVPVFLLSLAGVNEELLMEDESLLHVSRDAVIVLQHEGHAVPTSYVTGATRAAVEPRAAQRAIVAGLAAVVGGLAAPYEGFDVRHRRRKTDWLWGVGHHPFGPFSNTSSVSRLLLDTIQRNGVYAKVDTAIQGIRESLEDIKQFSDEYIHSPLGTRLPLPGEDKGALSRFLSKIYYDPSKPAHPIPHAVVENLEKQLDELESQLIQVAEHLYDHQLPEAHQLSSDLLQFVQGFYQYVELELVQARDQMKCCKVESALLLRSSQAFVYAGILIAGFAVYFLVIFFASPAGR
eukprot:SM000093S24438  [mRNA]  locus=s93:351148:356688:- [translate_table: standard]